TTKPFPAARPRSEGSRLNWKPFGPENAVACKKLFSPLKPANAAEPKAVPAGVGTCAEDTRAVWFEPVICGLSNFSSSSSDNPIRPESGELLSEERLAVPTWRMVALCSTVCDQTRVVEDSNAIRIPTRRAFIGNLLGPALTRRSRATGIARKPGTF